MEGKHGHLLSKKSTDHCVTETGVLARLASHRDHGTSSAALGPSGRSGDRSQLSSQLTDAGRRRKQITASSVGADEYSAPAARER